MASSQHCVSANAVTLGGLPHGPAVVHVQSTHTVSMGAHMKTTIDVSDALLQSAKELARQRQTTLRDVVEDGLRAVLREAGTTPRKAFKLADASVSGGKMLVRDPVQWRRMEEDHVVARVLRSARP